MNATKVWTEDEAQRLSNRELCDAVRAKGLKPRGGRGGMVAQLANVRGEQVACATLASLSTSPQHGVEPVRAAGKSVAAAAQSFPSPREASHEDRLLSVEDAARMLSLGRRTVWQMLSQGTFRRLKPTGKKRTCLSAMEVQAYIAKLRGVTNASI